MSTTESFAAEQRFVFYDVSYAGYQALLAARGDRPIRMTYDRGTLEIMSPSQKHERLKHLLGRMIVVVTEELEIPIRGAASTTWDRPDMERGLEADECYYISSEARVRGRETIDLDVDPPPDLAIEIDITHGPVDRLGIYAALGVAEVWRFDGDRLRIFRLAQGAEPQYHEQPGSDELPQVPVDELVRFLHARDETDETTWARSFRQWVREHLTR